MRIFRKMILDTVHFMGGRKLPSGSWGEPSFFPLMPIGFIIIPGSYIFVSNEPVKQFHLQISLKVDIFIPKRKLFPRLTIYRPQPLTQLKVSPVYMDDLYHLQNRPSASTEPVSGFQFFPAAYSYWFSSPGMHTRSWVVLYVQHFYLFPAPMF